MLHSKYIPSSEVIRIAKNQTPVIRYEVAIATRNPRLRYRILEFLNQLKLKFVVCAPDDSECEYAKVIITTKDEASRFDEIHLVIVEDETKDEFIIPLMMKLNDINRPMNGVLGIDPGMRFGMALVIDGITVRTKRVNSPTIAAKTTISWMDYVKHDFPLCQFRIRIGTGSRLYSTLYLREILRRDTELSIELVNEKNTTRIGKSDQSSAVLIAGRWGKSLGRNPDLSLAPKGGYIKSLKRLLSRLTEGKKVLSTEEAQLILQDEKPLDYFISSEVN
jgi:hypothetical protein